MRLKIDTAARDWERWDYRTERTIIPLSRVARKGPGGWVTLAVVDEPDNTWSWSLAHTTLSKIHAGEHLRGHAPSRSMAKALAVCAAELYLAELRGMQLIPAAAA